MKINKKKNITYFINSKTPFGCSKIIPFLLGTKCKTKTNKKKFKIK